jgi:hypothetical protein
MNSPRILLRIVHEPPLHSTAPPPPLSGTLYLTAVPPVKFSGDATRPTVYSYLARTSVRRLPHSLQVQTVRTERHAYSNSLTNTGECTANISHLVASAWRRPDFVQRDAADGLFKPSKKMATYLRWLRLFFLFCT